MAKFDGLNKISCLICGEEGGELCTSSSTKQIVFILSRVLKLPKDRIGYYLENYSREESWVRICLKCSSDFVDKCVKVHRELVEIQKRQEESDGRLINKIKQTVKRRKEPVNSSESLNVTEEIRAFVVNHDYGVCTSVPNHSHKATGNGLEETRIFNNQREEKVKTPAASVFEENGGAETPHDGGLTLAVKSEPLDSEAVSSDKDQDYDPLLELATLSDSDQDQEPKRHLRTRKRSSTRLEPPGRKLEEPPVKRPKKLAARKQPQLQERNSKISREKNPKPKDHVPKELKTRSGFSCDICRELVPRGAFLQHVQDHVKDYVLMCPNSDCSRPFCSITYYNLHLLICKSRDKSKKSEKYPTVCEVCGIQAASQIGLLGHLQFLHETPTSKIYPCPVSTCSETFTHRQTVYHHISRFHAAPKKALIMTVGVGKQRCRTCSKTFSQDNILEHFVTDHGISRESVVACKDCGYLSQDRLEFRDRVNIHFRSGAVVACDLCPAPVNFTTLAKFQQHYFTAHQIGTSFPCDKCDKVFMTSQKLERHVQAVHDRSLLKRQIKRFKCDECPEDDPRRFLYERDVRDHKIKVHGAEPYKCTSCEESFQTGNDLKNHEKSHKNIAIEQFPCTIPGCGKVFSCRRLLKKHTTSVEHVGRTNAVTCEICGAGFNHKTSLRVHQAKVHFSERKFICQECGKSFVTGEQLSRHLLIHTGELPYQCHLCEKRFRQTGTRRTHVKLVHEGFKRKRK